MILTALRRAGAGARAARAVVTRFLTSASLGGFSGGGVGTSIRRREGVGFPLSTSDVQGVER